MFDDSMIPDPLPETLLHFTSLFRSRAAQTDLRHSGAGTPGGDPLPHPAGADGRQHRDSRFRGRPNQTRHAAGASDRKSTRLNSSHVKISYAVFCLKIPTYMIELRKR